MAKTKAALYVLEKKQPRTLRGALLAGTIVAALIITGCHHHRAGTVRGTSRAPSANPAGKHANRKPSVPVAVGYSEQGTASWYGIPYHGRPAADGEIYNMETLVAAHRTLPFNTWLRVTNLQNNRSVDVRVIDRGPFVGNRIIDLSKAAARQIELLGPGIGPVRFEVISAPTDIPSNDFYAVQVGAFAVYANAERARGQYAARFGAAQLKIKQGVSPLYRVLVGRVSSMIAAQAIASQLQAEVGGVFIVRLDETVPATPPTTPAVPPPPQDQ